MEWEREEFLSELIRLEGRCGFEMCTVCKTHPAIYCCHDCLTLDLYCKDCILLRHASQPLHRIKGSYWIHTSLKNLDLVIQLGHPTGSPCCLPKPPHSDDFVIVHGNGIHSVTLRLCGCETAATPTQQLLQYRLFPASTDKPRTAATFSVLEEYHLLSLESKVSAHHYYTLLTRRSDNTGLSPPKVTFTQLQYHKLIFMRMAHEWRHLKMLKRSGRGHNPRGANGTKQGECAILCPACPQPGKNLPEDWDKMPKDKEAVSQDAVDPSLSKGWSYFVEEEPYKLYLHDPHKSTCSSHDAVNAADTKSAKGLAATSVGSICCARHEMKFPGGVGDLQKGERYTNMDYLFFSVLWNTTLKSFNVSYDIACQWTCHLWERMNTLPRSMHFPYEEKKITAFAPKFHLPAHIPECHWKYSFNFIKGVGQTDGEAPERGWSTLNTAASSTKEMGPGHQRNTLDDLIGDSNWKKFIGFRESILLKLKEAVPEQSEHQDDLREFEASLSEQYGTQLTKWKQDIEAWENDMSKPNPFEVKSHFITQASVRLQLAMDDARVTSISLHPDITASVLISTGIDLENQQCRLCLDSKKLGRHATEHQKLQHQKRCNVLMRHIEAWCSVQVLYMPRVASLRATDSQEWEVVRLPPAEELPLWLPSALASKIPCDVNLQEIEWKLRIGQACDALEELRQALQSQSYMIRFKDRFLRGQGTNTCTRNSLKLVDAKVDASSDRYRAAYGALLALSPLLQVGKTSRWNSTLWFLKDDDARAMTAGTEGRSSEGRRRVSWIWLVCGYGERTVESNADQDQQNAIRVEWCKAQEVELLVEEQRRILQFLCWEESWWFGKQATVATDNPALEEGLKAYALWQAALRHDLEKRFTHLWRDSQQFIALGTEDNTIANDAVALLSMTTSDSGI
ncbi:hypothetical protein L210DRAFT_3615051 [Boletus edulis BED1]|uniref:CxC2-like cysteine cluster KDZ transposase-associated domain-containing protein n=1 Tax=Boletus edulis BED1 TaxID=1328754 RepID=A0AAD4G7C7_BOLED|nr:hypothetical protein L210DRAFT_3615051 [Boletus edulis BED1]